MAASADPRTRQLYEFGPFRLDPEKELLLREDENVPIAPKAFQILLVLVRHNKQVVTKNDLMKTIWPDTFVEEANLSRNIFLLRKALGESPQDHQYIVTVPGRGYRFAEDVQLLGGHELDVVAASHSNVEVQVEETRPWGLIAAAAVLLVVVAAGAWKLFVHRAPPLTEKDTVVLADFTNSTGDPVFDETLRQGMAVALGQSPFLKIMDDDLLQRDLRLMNLQPGARISNQIAHDVCVREGSTATIDGAIANLGRSYVITLQAIACRDGATLAREQVQAEDKEDVLSALGSAATAMRAQLGESLSSIEKRNQPLEQATTSSLEALQSYTAAMALMAPGQFRAAIPLLERAISIDPNFAEAYYFLGVAYEQAGDMERSAQYANKALSMADRLSEPERTEITTYYYRFTGEWEKEIDTYRVAIRDDYPRNWSFHNQISLTYNDLGKFEDGLKEGLEANRLQPNVEPPYRRMMDANICLDRLQEAHQVADKARAQGIDGVRIHQRFLELAYVEDDKAAVAKETQWFAGKPEEYLSFGLQAADLNVHGLRRESHALYQRAADSAQSLGLRYVGDEFKEADARADALTGNCDTARRLGRPALALALCGETAQAEKLAAETSSRFPNGTIWNAVQLPEIQALIELNHNDPAKSIELMASASPYERAYPDAIYVRGLALLRMHKGPDAAAEFQKIVDHKGANWAATWMHPNWGQYYALSWLGIARGYALAGEFTQARNGYEKLFALWKTADPDLPVFKQAKAEYLKLK
jgi:eukaryotic-like serine/threonine-protein kinase